MTVSTSQEVVDTSDDEEGNPGDVIFGRKRLMSDFYENKRSVSIPKNKRK
jgi:hypothetical protein